MNGQMDFIVGEGYIYSWSILRLLYLYSKHAIKVYLNGNGNGVGIHNGKASKNK